MERRIANFWWIAVLLAAVLIRLAIAWYNTEANDNHLEVIQLLMKGEFPVVGSCWQCYHPKLFHLIGAAVLTLFEITDPLLQWRGVQLLNVLLSAGTLIYLFLFLAGEERYAPWNFIAFLLIAFNPKFAGISAQATNDTLVILASTAFFFHCWRWLCGNWKHRIPMAIAAGVAMAAKGSGLAIVLLLCIVLAVKFLLEWKEMKRRDFFRWIGIAFLLLLMISVASLSGYYQNGKKEGGSPFALNLSADPFPSFYEKSLEDRGGVVSIFHSFLTFPLISLVEDPVITGGKIAPENRYNFWAQIWGRHASTRFDDYPGTWQSHSPFVFILVRISILLQLIVALFLVTGVVCQIRAAWLNFRAKALPENWFPQLVLLLGAAGILLLVIKLNLSYRNYFTMKAIYLYPALLPAAWFIATGGEVWERLQPKLVKFFLPALAFLALIGVVDSTLLANDLANGYGRQVKNIGQVHCPDVVEGAVRLVDLPVVYERQGWGGMRTVDQAGQSSPAAGGRRWCDGFIGHAPSLIEFKIEPGRYRFLELQVAKDDLQPTGDGVQFCVEANREEIWCSGLIRHLSREKAKIEIPSSADRLTLKVDQLGNSHDDHIVWIAPRLLSTTP